MTKYLCDNCGKEMTADERSLIKALTNRYFRFTYEPQIAHDACRECQAKLLRDVADMLEGHWEQPAPQSLLATLKEWW